MTLEMLIGAILIGALAYFIFFRKDDLEGGMGKVSKGMKDTVESVPQERRRSVVKAVAIGGMVVAAILYFLGVIG